MELLTCRISSDSAPLQSRGDHLRFLRIQRPTAILAAVKLTVRCSGQAATKRQVQNMFWARACHKAVAVTASRPRTRNRVRPWLRAWALAHSTVDARSL